MKRILFVDDEPNVLDGLRRMLRPLRSQWSMMFLDSAEKALELLRQEADEALYAAKDGGRNQVQVATGPRNARTCERVAAGS